MGTLAEKIREITRKHLVENNGVLLAQCLRAVGWVANTVPSDIPDNKGLLELPTSDSSNGGIVTGFGLSGRRPIYVIRYQGFSWYNMVTPLNYAAKSLEMWGEPCPIFVRALAMEGAIGPVASGANHSIIAHMPGIKVFAPCTPEEYQKVWDSFMNDNCPYYVSEHRKTFDKTGLLEVGFFTGWAKVNVYLIGGARLITNELIESGLPINVIPLVNLKPLDQQIFRNNSGIEANIVVDSDYTTCGISEHIAYQIMSNGGPKTIAMGLDDRSAGFAPHKDNTTPSAEKVINKIKELLNA